MLKWLMYLDEKAAGIDLRSNSLSAKFPTHGCLSEWIFFCLGTWDFFALNHYTTYWAQDGLEGPNPSLQRDSGALEREDPSCPMSSSIWFRVCVKA